MRKDPEVLLQDAKLRIQELEHKLLEIVEELYRTQSINEIAKIVFDDIEDYENWLEDSWK